MFRPSDRRHVAIVCCGMDKVQRGYEIYARDLFELLKDEPEFELTLIKGSGIRNKSEKVVFNLHRDSFPNRLLCRFVGTQWKYYIEFASFAFGLLPLLLFNRFDAFYVLEASIYKFLSRWRQVSGGEFKLIHFTGGQLGRIPASAKDYLHHVTPCYVKQASECGFRPENQFLIPHFIDAIPELKSGRARHSVRAEAQFGEGGAQRTDAPYLEVPEERERLRSELGIPPGMPVVLSVGSIDAHVKRMDYVIRECAALSRSVFVLLLGHQDAASASIHSLASEKLGRGRFAVRTVPRLEILKYYRFADVFVLASLREGFGLVFLEALSCGLPVITHDYDVSRYVLGEHGYFGNLAEAGQLARLLEQVLTEPQTDAKRRARIEYVRQKYGAEQLKEDYRRMFLQVCGEMKDHETTDNRPLTKC